MKDAVIQKSKYSFLDNPNYPYLFFKKEYETKITILLLLLLFFASCGKEDDPQPPDPPNPPDPPVVVDFLDLSLNTINFAAEKDASLVVLRTDNNWKATCYTDWIKLSAYEGNKSMGFIIGASANKNFERETKITISAGDKTKEIRVKLFCLFFSRKGTVLQ